MLTALRLFSAEIVIIRVVERTIVWATMVGLVLKQKKGLSRRGTQEQRKAMAKSLKGPARRRAWNMESRYVRIRDCLATCNFPFAGVCITCNKRFHISFLDAGHLFAGGGNAKLFPKDDRQISAQCRICNQGRNGRSEKFRKVMEERYGVETVEQWEIESKKMVRDNEMDFDAIAKKYKEKYTELLRSAGFRDYDEGRGYL